MKISVFYEHILEAAAQENKSVEKICGLVSSYGITGVEIENTRLIREKNTVLDALGKANLSISCMYGFFDFAHEDGIQSGIDMVNLADELQIKKVMLIPGFLKKYEFLPGIYSARVTKMVNSLKSVCDYAKKKNIMTLLEDFDGREAPFAASKGLLYFLEHIPGLSCAFDTGNFLYSEEDAYEVLPLFLNRIGHVHCKDRTFQKREGEIPKATVKGREMYSCAVGAGCIKMKEILEKILETGYDDYFAIEHFGSLNQLEDMKNSARFIENMEAGI